MKTSVILNIVLAIALLIVSLQLIFCKDIKVETAQQQVEPPMPKEWRQVHIDSANIDAFKLFQNSAALTVGKKDSVNSMTIGWGEIGILWGRETHVVTVYVRKSRFTHHLMEENEYFTVEGFSSDYADNLKYLGTASGRDEDKIKGSGMTLKMMSSGAPAFEEGNLIIECRKLYSIDYTTQQMNSDVVSKWYSNEEDFDNIHTAYVGEIVSVWKK